MAASSMHRARSTQTPATVSSGKRRLRHSRHRTGATSSGFSTVSFNAILLSGRDAGQASLAIATVLHAPVAVIPTTREASRAARRARYPSEPSPATPLAFAERTFVVFHAYLGRGVWSAPAVLLVRPFRGRA